MIKWIWFNLVAAGAVMMALLLRAEAPPLPPGPSKHDEKLIALDRAALDEAYQAQILHLFGVWMKDETGQPARATKGFQQARRAYIEAMGELEKREQALKEK